MREIKFRSWNKPTQKMNYFELFDSMWRSLSADQRNTLPEFNELMQFTGLKDKNGKEIYEGDYLKKYHLDIWYEGQLKTDGMQWWIDNIVNEKEYMDSTSGKFCEVIGNIYENPDLLKN